MSLTVSGPIKRASPNKFCINNKRARRKSNESSVLNVADIHDHMMNLDGVVQVIDKLLLDPSMKDYYHLRLKEYPSLIIPLFDAIKTKKYELDFSNSYIIADYYESYSYIFSRLTNLKSLNISGCFLGDINYNLSIFLCLEKLNISNNCITNNGFKSICNNLCFLSSLRSINLSCNLFNIQSIASLRRIMYSIGDLEEFIFIVDVCDYCERDNKIDDWSNLFNDFGTNIVKLRNIETIRIKGLNYEFKTEGFKSIVESIISPVLRVLELDNFKGTIYNPFDCIDISFLKIVGMNSLEELIITRVNLGKCFSDLLKCVCSLHSLKTLILDVEGEYGTFEKELKKFVEYLSSKKDWKVLKLNEIFLCYELVYYYKQIEESNTLIEIDLPLYDRFPPMLLKRWKTNYNMRNIQGLYQLEELHLHGKVEDNFVIDNVEDRFNEFQSLMKLHLDLRECSNFEFAGILCCIKNSLKQLKVEALFSFERLFACIDECVHLEKLDISYSRFLIVEYPNCVNNIKNLIYLQEIIFNHCNMDTKNIILFLTEIHKSITSQDNSFLSLRSIDLRDNLYTSEKMLLKISSNLFVRIKYLNLTHLPIQNIDEEQRKKLISCNNIKCLPNCFNLDICRVTPSSTRLNRMGKPIEQYYLLKKQGAVIVLSDDTNLD